MKKMRTKYHLRPDGRIEATRVINGKQRHFYGRSDEEIEQKIAAALGEAARVPTMSEYAARWWENKEPELSVNTVRGYACAVNRISERFKDIPITDVTPQAIVAFLNEFAALGYSQKVISNTKCVIKMILDLAFVDGRIQSNPAAYLPPVKGKKKQPRQAAPKSDRELIELHRADDLISTMMYFMLYTGARKGEAVALQFRDIDRKAKTARICKSCAWDGPKPLIKEPKTAAGVRTVLLPDKLLEVLPKGKGEDYVFFPDGLPNRTPLDKAIRAYQDRNGISSTPHQLRHSYASLLHSAGIDVKDAQVLLGHSTIAMTQDIYTHLEEEHKTDVAEQLNSYIVKSHRQKA